MSPAEALRRIAYLLEAEGADSYKARAFRRAATVVDATPAAELRRLDEQRRLESLPGVGKSTAAVIAEALAGSVPAYLQALEDEAQTLPASPARVLFEALRGDCHSHSDWSDGGSSIEEMARAAAELGRDYLVLTDHSPRLTVANGLSADELRRQLDVVAELNESLAPFRLLTGIEVDILDDGLLDQEEDLLAALDVVVASVHSKLRMEAAEMTTRMTIAVENPHVDILGHCTGRRIIGRGRPQSTFDHEAVFAACQRSGTAVEINSRPDRRDPPEDLLRIAAAAGCQFSIDSDAHAPGQLSWIRLGCEQAVEAGVPPSSIVNTKPLEDLLAWAKAR
ncbi:MAG TPA: PHP domain-containing protein [Acidimicrobiales bacterium]|nr:PHP domain-containing protein [Acidimicrobiales bacterium]